MKETKKPEGDLTDKKWTTEDIQNLTKGIVKFPAGTQDRWKVIAEYIGMTPKETITKAKEMQERQQKDILARR